MRPKAASTRWPSVVACFCFALGLLVAGCDKSPGAGVTAPASTTASARENTVVARIGTRTITLGELEQRLASQKEYVRMRFGTPERMKVFLEKLVRLEVLAAEAERRGLDKNPEVVRRVKQALVDELVGELNATLVKFSDITDADVAARYERDRAQHQRPAQVRIAQIVVASEARAKELLQELKKAPRAERLFAKFVQLHSIDMATKARTGDLGYLDPNDAKLAEPLRKVGASLTKLWQLSDPVKVGERYHLLMCTGKRPALNRPLALVRDRIRNQLFHERRYEAVKAFADGLRKKAKVQIDEASLAKVRVSPPRPKLVLPPSQRSATGGK